MTISLLVCFVTTRSKSASRDRLEDSIYSGFHHIVCAESGCVRIAMAGWLHGVFVGEWLFVFPLCGFSLSLFCNYHSTISSLLRPVRVLVDDCRTCSSCTSARLRANARTVVTTPSVLMLTLCTCTALWCTVIRYCMWHAPVRVFVTHLYVSHTRAGELKAPVHSFESTGYVARSSSSSSIMIS